MSQLDGATILITGAGGGFGREMIRQLVAAGSYLILADRELPALHAAASEVAATLGARGGRGRILGYAAADLSSAEGCAALQQQVAAIAPAIDILINNAGIAYGGPFTAIPAERWERLMAINLLAPMRLTALFLPQMLARRRGHLVNISSAAGLIGTPGLAAYSAAKFGLRGFGEALANELAGQGIAVTTIYPFFARTPILDSAQFGPGTPLTIPPWLLYEPAQVVRALLRGIQRNQRHVYPGAIPRLIDLLQRLAPWALPLLARPRRG